MLLRQRWRRIPRNITPGFSCFTLRLEASRSPRSNEAGLAMSRRARSVSSACRAAVDALWSLYETHFPRERTTGFEPATLTLAR